MNFRFYRIIRKKIKDIELQIKSDKRDRNRYLILFISILFFFDYFIFCYLTETNPFHILPPIPVLDDRVLINVYLPDLDGKNILKETRKTAIIDDKIEFSKLLFREVISGSDYENTSLIVPVNIYLRKVWIYDKNCIFDISTSLIDDDIELISGSERLFKTALNKTITENIKSIERVIILNQGIPVKRIWEIPGS